MGTLAQKFWARVQKSDGCWLWTGQSKAPGSYGRMKLAGKFVRAHRLSWRLHFGNIPEGMDVCHRCDNPSCVRPEHLFLGDHDANMADMAQKGRVPLSPHLRAHGFSKGVANPDAKLSEDDVREIRRLLSERVPRREIAARFGVSTGPIAGIASGRTWKHVN